MKLELMKPRSGIKLLHVRTSGADKKDQGNKVSESGWELHMPKYIDAMNANMATKQKMNLDHRRAQTIPGLSALAMWAFGPCGLPNLKVLAYGDFSHHGRYIEDCFMFGVNKKNTRENQVPGYYLLQKDERNDVIVQYGDFLGACPVDVHRDMGVPAIE